MERVKIWCTEMCYYEADVELTDDAAPRYCPICNGDLEVMDTGEAWPLATAAVADLRGAR